MGKKILLVLLMLAMFIGCSVSHWVTHYTIDELYTLWQVDSVCVVEEIPPISEYDSLWIQSGLINLDAREVYDEYAYIKSDKVVYIVIPDDSLYIFRKRVTEKIKNEK